MASKNKFGIEPPSPDGNGVRVRSVGPMGAAVREAAEDLQAATDAKIEQRRRNAEDAKAFRQAEEEGRVLVRLDLGQISTSALPRDRMDLEAVALADEMEELKASIRARGQKEPIEVFRDADGILQLKKGWRRLTALRQLHAETGGDAFATILARVDGADSGQLERYIDMVEENVVREDLTFAEMAQVVLDASTDPEVDETDPEALVIRLYGSLHKMKRSYIRAFVYLLRELGQSLRFPKALSRNLGVEVARKLQGEADGSNLKSALKDCDSPDRQREVLEAFVKGRGQKGPTARAPRDGKFSFKTGEAKVTARRGECRILMDVDFTGVPRNRLEAAVFAFEKVMKQQD